MAGPGRPSTEKTTVQALNGVPVFLGILVSGGTTSPVNNLTTATPFLSAMQGPGNYTGTLAGKTLLIQPTAAGVMLTSTTSVVTVALQTTTPSATAIPGVLIGANVASIVIMSPTSGWLQWLGSAAASNLLVWELT